MNYASGIFTPDQDCVSQVSGAPPTQEECAKEVDHAMLLVGYGTDSATGLDFWCVLFSVSICPVRLASCMDPDQPFIHASINRHRILKNTWSTTWGEGGYMRLQRNTGLAACGTSCINAFPVAAVQGKEGMA